MHYKEISFVYSLQEVDEDIQEEILLEIIADVELESEENGQIEYDFSWKAWDKNSQRFEDFLISDFDKKMIVNEIISRIEKL